MFDVKPVTLYNPRELLAEKWTDFDVMRAKPIAFRSGGSVIVCMPVTYREHPVFLKDMSSLIVSYYEIFRNAVWLSSRTYRDRERLQKVVDSVTLFAGTKSYEKFITHGVPRFIARWAWTVRRDGDEERFVRIRSRRAGLKLLNPFLADEILKMLFTIFVFNYDMIKASAADFLRTLGLDAEGIQGRIEASACSTFTTASTLQVMPPYSDKPFSRDALNLLERQSSTSGRRH